MFRLLLMAVTLCAMSAGPLSAAELRIGVEGVRNDTGKLMVALHVAKESVKFPDGSGAVAAQWRTAKEGAMWFVFPDLVPGRYAVAVFHDENDNGELDRNFIGIPVEGYGFSRDARGFAGPPGFDAAAIEIAGDNVAAGLEISAKLSY